MNDNTFTEEGSLAMAEVLPNLQELRVINFGDCLVRSDGARAIAEAIKEGHKLLEVGVSTTGGGCVHYWWRAPLLSCDQLLPKPRNRCSPSLGLYLRNVRMLVTYVCCCCDN